MYKRKTLLRAAIALVLLLGLGCGRAEETPALPEVSVSEAADSGKAASAVASEPAPDKSGETGAVLRQAAEGERLYTISIDEVTTLTLDKDGNEVLPKPKDETAEYVELTDLATGEARYKYLTREEIYRDEYGYPQRRYLYSLYDMDGNQIIDWEPKNYRGAFGEYIIRQDVLGMGFYPDEVPDYKTALYHVPTGEERYEGTYGVEKLDDNAFLLTRVGSAPLGVADVNGDVVSGFPTPKPYYNARVWYGCLVANSWPSNEKRPEGAEIEHILDRNFNESSSFEWISGYYGHMGGEYLTYIRDGESGILDPKGEILFSVKGASVEYYDGELAITQTGQYRSVENPIVAFLVKAENGNPMGIFSWLAPARSYYNYDTKEPAAKFLGITGDMAVLIGRDGKTLALSEPLPGVRYIEMLCDGLYIYHVEGETSYGVGLLGPNLELIVPADRYYSIQMDGYVADEWDGNVENIVLRAHGNIGTDEPNHALYRYDVFDHTGKIIVDNATEIYDIGPDRIALKRGFNVGLMDWNGNWIVKRSIFQGFGDD